MSPPEFVSIDGEAIKTGEYVLMRDSTGREIINEHGLTSAQSFKWLLGLDQGKGHRNREYVVFGLNYDANQWLSSLTPGQLRTLLDVGEITVWNRYRIQWMPAKAFELTDLTNGRWIKICEVFGFFQSSFVKALKAWGFEVPERMQEMKGARNDFTGRDIAQMSAYCLEECEYLSELMGKLADACQRANCAPARNWWIGAGSVANALMRYHGVRDHVAHDPDIADQSTVEDYVLRAYFGGRVELLNIGTIPVCHTRDIRSAYPHAATGLPSLAGAELRKVKRYNPALKHAIWRVSWKDQGHGQLAPFPTRAKGFSIIYPRSGEGCYHACEVATALALGYQIKIHDGVRLHYDKQLASPFGFLPEIFHERAKLKAKGDAAEKALKLGMNSVYGKLAQGYGRTNSAGVTFPPPYQSYMWAGEITATTRARVLVAAHASKDVMMISTDGVFMRAPGVRATTKPELGSWEAGQIDNLFCAMAGVYQGFRDGDEEVCKSRGFFARDVNYTALREVYETDGVLGQYSYTSRRFIGARVALARNKPELWRQWVDEKRSISLYPDPWRKQWEESFSGGGLGSEIKAARVEPLPGGGEVTRLYPVDRHIESLPYEPKTALYDLTADIDEIEAMIGDDQPDYDV